MTEKRNSEVHAFRTEDNPLIWSVLNRLEASTSSWKIHVLASELINDQLIPILDEQPEKDLFKRNFLLMNALYQLQAMLVPEKWLNVEAMSIELMPFDAVNHGISPSDPLREYYLDWSHYEADALEVKRLLNEFWERYQSHVGAKDVTMSQKKAYDFFNLDESATLNEIRQAWRRCALKWHPDRDGGDAEQFKLACQAWSLLK
ncbi:DNA-J related domain-containing protein [Vibrio methylphosphonaticus]|uniref:DNA-J related domain-containing protein n=1 Tax=Vibrio methylphosphonaticus TaxID=2946866 RepID=UPI00202A641E|nr:DNA-J related domain-containing protein [Vibrio methylphosphonaticus]MCL9776637.1 DnaJ domain-containing protein [Vibrio methylphosphonaticus]